VTPGERIGEAPQSRLQVCKRQLSGCNRGLQVCKRQLSGCNRGLQVCKRQLSGCNRGLQVCKRQLSGCNRDCRSANANCQAAAATVNRRPQSPCSETARCNRNCSPQPFSGSFWFHRPFKKVRWGQDVWSSDLL